MIAFRLAAVLALQWAAPAFSQAADTPITIGRAHAIASRHLGDTRIVNIYLPEGYAKGSKRYPVLYLIDGGLDQDFLHVVGSAQLGAIWGRSEPVIVVGVETKDRRRELVGPTGDPALLKKYPTAGHSAAFRAYLRDEVKPFVARHYRVSGEDSVIGESLAGLFVVETYLRDPDLFDRYAAISPSLWWDKEALLREADALVARQKRVPQRLYVATAEEGPEMQAADERLVRALRDSRAPRTWCHAPHREATHATIYHMVVPEALQYLWPTPTPPAPEMGFVVPCSQKS